MIAQDEATLLHLGEWTGFSRC